MSRFTAVLFDFGGTLDSDGVHWAPRFYAAYRAAGGITAYADFERAFQTSDAALAGQPGVRTLGFRATLDAQARLLRDLLPDDRTWDIAGAAAAFYADALATVARNGPVLERLGRRYRLAVVSNFTGNLEPCLRELGLARYFTAMVDSALVGFAKPDPRIFVEALQRVGSAPEEAWMVGDNFEADIRPAATLGICTCWLAPSDRPGPSGPTPTARIRRLVEVEGVLV